MKLDKLVVNASPIISLANIGCVNLLTDLSLELIIPDGVYREIVNHACKDPAVEWVEAQDSCLFQAVEVPVIIGSWNLGKGESEVISYAYSNKEFSAVIDDCPAKRCAGVFDINVFGTIGLLIFAKRSGHVPRIKPLLTGLQSTGFRIKEDIIATALQLAEE